MHPEFVHPDLKGIVSSKGGLFDASSIPGYEAMAKNIGRSCYFTVPSCGVEKEDGWFVVGVQKDYQGTLAYSLYKDGLGITRCTNPSQIAWK